MAGQQDLKDRLTERQAASGEPAATPPILAALRDDKQREQIAMALPKSIPVERFMRIVETTVKLEPDLLKCTVPSLMGACHRAAMLGLEPGPLRHCWLLPYYNTDRQVHEVQFQLGYPGIIELARRSGRLKSIVAKAVYKADEFAYEYGLDEKLRHIPNDEVDPVRPKVTGERPGKLEPGDITHFWMLAKFLDGGHHWMVANPAKIEQHRLSSKASASPAWRQWYEEMGCKTMIRMAQSYLPLTYEAAAAIEHDEEVISRMPQQGENYIDVGGQDISGQGGQADDDALVDGKCPECGFDEGHSDNCSFDRPDADT